MRNIKTLITGLFTILVISAAANAATWTVTKSANSNDNICDADCSLREAVFNADSGDTVVFNSNLVGQTFTLGGSEIIITKRITIDGFLNDPNVAFISGSNTSRIFLIQTGGGLDLKNAILVQGNGKPDANYQFSGEGGAIAALNASLTLDRVAFRGNKAKYSGAVLLNGGTHHFKNSSFTGNSAETNTALGLRIGATLYMSNTTVSGNNNFIGDGDTFGGGAIVLHTSNLIVRNSTIANNSGVLGGGIGCVGGNGNYIIDIGNTIIAENTASLSGQDIYFIPSFTIISRGGNLIGDLDTVPANTFDQPNDIFGVNPLLGPINANQGGHPVTTHPLQAGSPARNGGLNAVAVDPLTNQPLTTDARGAGFPRIADTTVDKGAFEDQSGNTSLIVTKNTNSNDLVCDTDCSLREAVHQASLNFGTDTITFAANVFGTLSLGGAEILIQNQSVNIVGYPNLNANTLTVSGGNNNRIFRLNNATANISGMTLSGGRAGAPNQLGGAIFASNSNLTLDRIMLAGNNADAYAAVYIDGGTTQRVINSTISGNAAAFNGGVGIRQTTLYMANTTVSGNVNTGSGGSIFSQEGALHIRNSTIAFNRSSDFTAGIQLANNSTLNIGNSIVAQNVAAPSPDILNTSGSIISAGGNLIGNTNGFPAGTFSQTNDATGIDPMLNGLDDNGGVVRTHALMPNSPAINAGLNANAIDPFDNSALATDARGAGFSRIQNSVVDKGAFELLAPTAASVSISGTVTDGKSGIARASVLLTSSNGETRTVRTNSFGYFQLDDVPAGATYIVNIYSKGLTFSPQIVPVYENISDLVFLPEE